MVDEESEQRQCDKGSAMSERSVQPSPPGNEEIGGPMLPRQHIPDSTHPLMVAYREGLVSGKEKAQEQLDKVLLALSGGAIGFSFTFVKELLGVSAVSRGWLYTSWLCWIVSLTLILISFILSTASFNRAIDQFDNNRLNDERPGGIFSRSTAAANYISAGSFLVGVITFIIFVARNLGG